MLARELGRPPREIAEEIASSLDLAAAGVESADVAGPGFLNFRLGSAAAASAVDDILRADEEYGRSDSGQGAVVMVEFVSANPTGPLHLGHGRQAALGDAVAALLEWTGWRVHREFYYNDRGRQMELLAESVRARYRQHLGRDEPVPEDGYRGEYVLDIAEQLEEEVGDRYLDDDSEEVLGAVRQFAVARLRAEQDRDLAEFRVHFDHRFLESSLYDEGHVDATIQALRDTGVVYERDGATWLRTTDFGDQKDRVMVRSNGLPTYFLPDVAYHMNKWRRGFERVINVRDPITTGPSTACGADFRRSVSRRLSRVRAPSDGSRRAIR